MKAGRLAASHVGRRSIGKHAMQGTLSAGGRTRFFFHEEIVHPQCKICNVWKRGNYQAYTLYMLDKYGREKVDEFLQLKHQVRKYTTSELEEMIGKYKQKLSELA